MTVTETLRFGRRTQWLRTWLTIISVIIASSSTGLGMVVWATQHYDRVVNAQAEQSQLLRLYGTQLNAMTASLTDLASKENALAIAVGKLQGFIGGREGSAAPPGLLQ